MLPQRLMQGHRAYREKASGPQRVRFAAQARAQQPQTMVIGCCDSRVAPETVFDADPGELFVCRNIANLVQRSDSPMGDASVAAALEYAVLALAVKHIVMLGHAGCGGIAAFARRATPLSAQNYTTLLEQASVAMSLRHLRSYPCVATAVEAGSLTLHGAHFDIRTGALALYDQHTAGFIRVA
ncbi:carbonic anhydrase [Saliniramus sp.]|uniref:carbonic anhydrase n=1 Tax=Saliniramus sp. TaxID=2986772 RepID=UPI002BB31DB3|nr:carbonic anhydrase [Saliniramus sp.]HMB11963.1 carbonic anhydrase [Saliniramus sp.]